MDHIDNCLTCPAGQTSLAGASVCRTACVAGKYVVGVGCTDCEAGKYSVNLDSPSCAGCLPGAYSTTVRATSASVCVMCPSNTFSQAGAASCVPCQANALSVAGSTGQEFCYCAPGYAHAAGVFTCRICDRGTWNSQLGRSACSNCSVGLYSLNFGAVGNETCLPCVPGQWSPEGSANCNLCPANSRAAANSGLLSNCVCDAGYTGPNGGPCTACPAGQYKTVTGAGACVSCAAGTYSITAGASSASVCVNCPPGDYSGTAGASSVSACIDCAAGTYSSVSGASSASVCVNCPPGDYSGTAGASSVSACIDCVAGTYSGATGANSSNTCVPCPPGVFSGVAGASSSTVCVLCPAGAYSNTAGASACVNCVAGTYSGATGANSSNTCVPCPAGAFSGVAGATNASACVLCPAGTYSAAGASACASCPAGASSVLGSTSIANCVCNAGFYGANGGACTACASTFTSLSGSLTAADCVCPLNQYTTYSDILNIQRQCGDNNDERCSSTQSADKNTQGTRNGIKDTASRWALDNWLATANYAVSINGNTWFRIDLGRPRLISKFQFILRGTDNYYQSWHTDNTNYYAVQIGDIDALDANPICAIGMQTSLTTGTETKFCVKQCLSIDMNTRSGTALSQCRNSMEWQPMTGRFVYIRSANPDDLTMYRSNDLSFIEIEITSVVLIGCTPCPVQSSVTFKNTTKYIYDCKCNIGYTGVDGGACTACVSGTFKNVSGSSPCTSCPARTYSSTVGANASTVCTTCPAATYSSNVGASACTSCPATLTSVSGSTSYSDCGCPANTYTTFTSIPNIQWKCGVNQNEACSALVEPQYYQSPASAVIDSVGTSISDGYYSVMSAYATTEKPCIFWRVDLGIVREIMSFQIWKQDARDLLVQVGNIDALDANPTCGYYKINTYDYWDSTLNRQEAKILSCTDGVMNGRYFFITGRQNNVCIAGSSFLLRMVRITGAAPTCTECPANTNNSFAKYKDISSCWCRPGAYYASSSCVLCVSGKFWVNGQCSNCPDNTYSNVDGATICSNCSIGYGSITGRSTCQCAAGYAVTSDGNCALCEVSKFKSVIADTNCTSCNAGTYMAGVGATVCVACAANADADVPRVECRCNAGTTGNGSVCVLCGAGKYKGVTGNESCADCPANSYSGTVGSSVVTSCTCNAGASGPNGGPCALCVAGKYKTVIGSSVCTNCSANTFSTVVGATSVGACSSCPANSQSGGSSAACVCNKGYTGPDGGPCLACVAGTFKAQIGSAECTLCLANTFSGVVGSTNASVCQACQAKAIAVAGSVGQEYCYCEPGYAHLEGRHSCRDCAPGTYNSQLGQRACSNCTIGMYSVNWTATSRETCRLCQAGKWSPEGSANCNMCPANSKTLNVSGLITDCVCDPGYVGPGGSTCVGCAAGLYKDTSGSVGCVSCPALMSSFVGTARETDCWCVTGYMKVSGTCVRMVPRPVEISGTLENMPPNPTAELMELMTKELRWGLAAQLNVAVDMVQVEIANTSSVQVLIFPRSETELALLQSKVGLATAAPTQSALPFLFLATGPYSRGEPRTVVLTVVVQTDMDYRPERPSQLMSTVLTEMSEYFDVPLYDIRYRLDASQAAEVPRVILSIATTSNEEYVRVLSAAQALLAQGNVTLPEMRIDVLDVGDAGPSGLNFTHAMIRPDGSAMSGAEVQASLPVLIRQLSWFYDVPEYDVHVVVTANASACVDLSGTRTCFDPVHTVEVLIEANGLNMTLRLEFKYDLMSQTVETPQPLVLDIPFELDNVFYFTNSGVDDFYVEMELLGSDGMFLEDAQVAQTDEALTWHLAEFFGVDASSVHFETIPPRYPMLSNASSVRVSIECDPVKLAEMLQRAAQLTATATVLVPPFKLKYLDAVAQREIHGQMVDGRFVQCAPNFIVDALACKCKPGHVLSGAACVPCAGGTYSTALDALQCTPCSAATFSAAGATACASCHANSNASTGSSSQDACQCNPGFFFLTLVENGLGYNTAANQYCLPCVDGSYKNGSGNWNCSVCAASDYSLNALSCDSCNYGYGRSGSNDSNTSLCVSCPPGSFTAAPGNGACVDCPADTFSNVSAVTSCKACPLGYRSLPGTIEPQDCCALNSKPQKSTTLMCLCNAGYTGPDRGASKGQCSACLAGTYKATNGAANCTKCSVGTYSPTFAADSNTTCAVCAAGQYAPEASANCTVCPANSAAPAGSGLITNCLCNTGFTGPNGGPCVNCVPGTYKPTNGGATCTRCPLNSNSSAGSVNITDCTCDAWCSGPGGGPCISKNSTLNVSSGEYQCSPGFTGPDRTGPCLACALGKYKNVPGPVACSSCEPGQYQDALATTSCWSCAPDTFSNASGAPLCTQCPAGFRALSGTTTIQDCCALNSAPFSANSTIGCSCNTGYTGPDAGASKGQCSACLPGTYKDSNGTANCTRCPFNSNSSAGSRDITDCICDAWCDGPGGGPCVPKNSTFNATSNVYQCSPGYTGPDSTGPCVACAVGTFKNVSGSAACALCPSGQYQTEKGSRSCVACPPDTFQNATGSVGCQACPTGFKALPGTTMVQDCCGLNSRPEIYEIPCILPNLARSCGTSGDQACPPSARTFYQYSTDYFPPQYANDGGGQSYVSAGAGSEWWQVDFTRQVTVNSVVIYNRGYRPETLANFNLQLSIDGTNFINCATGQYGSTDWSANLMSTHTCIGPARFLRISMNVPNGAYMQVQEVLVYGVRTTCAFPTQCLCNTGYTGPDRGASKGQCAICPSGTYKPTNGSAACTGCAANSNSSAGSMIVTSCSCNPGYTGPNGGPCVACEAGKFKNTSGTTACDVCAANTYSASGASVCTTCLPGFQSPAGSTQVLDCCDPNTTYTKNIYDTLSSATKAKLSLSSYFPPYVVRVSSVPELTYWDGRAQPAIPPAYISSGGYNGQAFLRFSKTSSTSGLSYLPSKMFLDTRVGITVVTVVRFTESISGAFWSMDWNTKRPFEIRLSATFQLCVYSELTSQAGNYDNVNTCTDETLPLNVWLQVSYTYNPSAWPRQTLKVTYLSITDATVVLTKTSTSSILYTGDYGWIGSKSALGYLTYPPCSGGWDVVVIQNPQNNPICNRPNFDLAGFYMIQIAASDADIVVLFQAIATDSQILFDKSSSCPCNGGFAGTGRSDCKSCAPGTYKSEIRTGWCSLCVANTYSTAVQATNVSTCVSCPNNSVSVPGRFECECTFGYQGDMFNCAACVPGKFKRVLGTSACVDCPANMEAPGSASIVCASLPGYNGLGYALEDVARSCGASLSGTCSTLSNGATSNAAGGADGGLDGSAGTSVSVAFGQNLARSCGTTGTTACATTAGSVFRPWWGVDFGRSRSVFAVNVMSSNWASTKDFKVVVGDVPDAQSPLNAVCADYLVGTGSEYVKFTCEDTVSGRYLYVVNGPHAANSLILSDVTVDAFNYAANASLMLPWWAVDFEAERAVSGLVIQAQASSVIQVRVGHSTDPLQNAICAQNRTLLTAGNNNITCPSAMLGRYLFVLGTGNTLLVLNDVRVLGAPTAQCAAGTYKPLVGNTNCTACPASSTSVIGATSIAQCSCRAGYLDVWS